jgi:cytoskeletal protein RodZ
LTVIYTAQSEVPQKKTRGALLPLLVVLFLISYGILTLLVVEQGRTIDAQRNLLREMLKDSTQLATLKNKLAREDSAQTHDKSSAQSTQKQAASGSSPSVAPRTPSKETKRPGKTARTLREIPEKPAADLQDVRRSTRVI